MVKVNFQTKIPKAVQNWIYEQEIEDHLLEAEKRLKRALSNVPQFKQTGEVFVVNLTESKDLIGDCSIILDANDESEAREEFKRLFGKMAKKQKFRMTTFKVV